jgi:hypothetical protein
MTGRGQGSYNPTPAVNPPAVNPPAVNPPAVNPPAVNPPAVNPPAVNPPVEQGYIFDPVSEQYRIQDPTNVRSTPFNSPNSKQPYASNLARALEHHWNNNRPVCQVTFLGANDRAF